MAPRTNKIERLAALQARLATIAWNIEFTDPELAALHVAYVARWHGGTIPPAACFIRRERDDHGRPGPHVLGWWPTRATWRLIKVTKLLSARPAGHARAKVHAWLRAAAAPASIAYRAAHPACERPGCGAPTRDVHHETPSFDALAARALAGIDADALYQAHHDWWADTDLPADLAPARRIVTWHQDGTARLIALCGPHHDAVTYHRRAVA